MRTHWLTFLHLLLLHPSISRAQSAGETGSAAPGQALDFASSASLAAVLLKVMGGLVLVVGIMFLIVMWLKKMGLANGAVHQGKLVKLIDSKMIAPKKYVAVVQVGRDLLALGVSDQQITMLHRLSPQDKTVETADSDKGDKDSSFSGILKKATGYKKSAIQR